MPSQSGLFTSGPIQTAVQPTAIFCHQEFLEKLESYRNSPVGKRVTLLLQNLCIDARRQHFKSTRGQNKGWRRSRLGGSGGSHFYAWWAPASAAPMRKDAGFGDAPTGAIILRDIRHHDDHSTAMPHDFAQNYLAVGVKEIRQEDFGPAPWTSTQSEFAAARGRVRLLKGHPGSGKTTALLHAADAAGSRKTLYVTYSRDLATLARAYFDKFCSGDRTFDVFTYAAFLREISFAKDTPAVSLAESRKRFQSDLANHARSLGPWTGEISALYDELHAHLVGSALPHELGRFHACKVPRQPDRNYMDRRGRFIGASAAASALDIATRLERADPRTLAERYFPELWLAWKAAVSVAARPMALTSFYDYACIAVDECQDLTPLESFVLAELARNSKGDGAMPPCFLAAGDEAQTVRPTDFEWGWFSDILHGRVAKPSEFKLMSNLRSPRRLANLVNRVWNLYGRLEKRDRPSGTGHAEIEDDSTDQLFFCPAAPGPDLSDLLRNLAGRAGLAIVSLDGSIHPAIPEDLRGSILSSADVKGLDFHSVCVLDAGPRLSGLQDSSLSTTPVESLRRRLSIDQLRVALSRPTERLIWLDIAPKSDVVGATLGFINFDEIAHVAQSVPAAVLKSLDEEELDIEERIQLCMGDARQLLDVKPDLAWSRAMLASTLLGGGRETTYVQDPALRQTVQLTAAEISFVLGMRGVKLGSSLADLDLFEKAAFLLSAAREVRLGEVVRAVREVMKVTAGDNTQSIFRLASTIAQSENLELPAWMLLALQPKISYWVDHLENLVPVEQNAKLLLPVLPKFYKALRLKDGEERARTLRDRAMQTAIKAKRFAEALALIQMEPRGPRTKTEAMCLEKTGAFLQGAVVYEELGDIDGAIDCYRQIPDVDAAHRLMQSLPTGHTAKEAYAWMLEVRGVFAKRPANFSRVMTAPEKKALEMLLEQGLGVQKKVTAKRAAATVKKKAAPKSNF